MSLPRSLVRVSPSARSLARLVPSPIACFSTLLSSHHSSSAQTPSTASFARAQHRSFSSSSSSLLATPTPSDDANLSPEQRQIEKLKDLSNELGRNLKSDEIPRSLLVHPYLPDDTRPRFGPPITYQALLKLPEVSPYLNTYTPILRHISLGRPDQPMSYSIVRLVDTAELKIKEKEDLVKAKASAKARQAASKPNALGINSGLRNQAIPKELEATWVMAENDLNHRVKQARDYLANAHKVTITLRPKRSGRKLKMSADHKEEMMAKIDALVGDVAEKWKEDVVRGEATLL